MNIGRLRALSLLVLVACSSTPHAREPAPPPPVTKPEPPPPPPPQTTDIDSHDILGRSEQVPPVLVKHVLLGWADLATNYQGRLDPRAAKRTQVEAATLALDVAAKLRADPTAIDALITAHSEDPGSLTKDPYTITAETSFVPEFKNLALRLHLGEVGIVTTIYGYHVVIRVPPPPPDPLESIDILARAAVAASVDVQHILIGWDGLAASRDPRAHRTKAEADALATEVLAKVRAGGDMPALMKQYSEDPGSSASGKPYTVTADAPMVEPFKELSLRLNVGEAGLVRTAFGWHIIKRIPPPPPDPLESNAILARTTVATAVKVKHILLGWTDVHAEDPRGSARTRKQLEKLVKATVAKLKSGAAIEPLMKELSEDPGSAASGESYDVSPNGGFVKEFLDLSLRLRVDEIGVVKTTFGIHIIKRVE